MAAVFPTASLYNCPLPIDWGLTVRLFVLRGFCTVLLLLTTVGVIAAEAQRFSSEELRQRYLGLVDDLRCPQCQNQNLSDSDSPIAQDLRRTVLRMLEQGDSDEQIIDYLIDRYGDFIIYMPRFKPTTYALWLLPAGLAVLGVVLVLLIIRRQRRTGSVADGDSLSAEQQQRLSALLESSDQGRDGGEQL